MPSLSNFDMVDITYLCSGGGTVDFQEFVGGLSAFSSRGGREEKLKCMSLYAFGQNSRDTRRVCFRQLRSKCTMSIGTVTFQTGNYFWC